MTGRERVVHYEFGKDGVTPVATATSPHIKASPKAEREPGFYWVRVDDDWGIAEWSGERWYQIGFDPGEECPGDIVDDRLFAEIGERAERLNPQPITDAQKTGERFLVKYEGGAVCACSIGEETRTIEIWLPLGWYSARWLRGCWKLHSEDDDRVIAFAGVATDYLPLPPDV